MVVWAWCCALITDYAVLPFDEAEQAVEAFMRGRQGIQVPRTDDYILTMTDWSRVLPGQLDGHTHTRASGMRHGH